MNACEFLAPIGLASLIGEPSTPDWTDEDDPDAVAAATAESRRSDHARAREILLGTKPRPFAGKKGVSWVRRITWPDRVPATKVWAGQMDLCKIIANLQAMLRKAEGDDLLAARSGATGVTGLDSLAAQSSRDVGFSAATLGMEVVQRPGLELLAILGLEAVPIVSYSGRRVGIIHDSVAYAFDIEPRGGYYRRWGMVERVRLSCPQQSRHDQ